ncbi:MAG: hypothetical protein KBD39_12525, partial [Sterolibacterium sp.]|nr:hypothetical protein [Sterolibacterium sp.]
DWHGDAIETDAITTDGPTNTPPTFTVSVTPSNKFYYNDFGKVKFTATNTVVDKTFTDTVSGDKTGGDCDTGSPYSNVANAGSGWKYGCYIGSPVPAVTETARFRPYRYVLTSTLTSAGACGFTYVGTNFGGGSFVLEAQSAANTVLKRLNSTLSPPDAPTFVAKTYNGSTVVTDAPFSPALPSQVWTAGKYEVPSFAGTQVTRSTPIGHYDEFKVGAIVTNNPNTDLVQFALCYDGAGHNGTITGGGTNVTTCVPAAESATKLRFGMIKLDNAYGTQQLPLDLKATIYYWQKVGSNTNWVPNTLDDCTTLKPANTLAYGNLKGGISLSQLYTTTMSNGGVAKSGEVLVRFQPPGSGASGSYDVALNLGSVAGIGSDSCLWTLPALPPKDSTDFNNLAHLKGNWCGSAYNKSPAARVTFGAAKAPFIYRREKY